MSRTNVDVDDELVAKVMRVYRLKTKREAIDFALRRLVGSYKPRDMLDLQGMGWEGDIDEIKRSRVDDL